MFNFQKSPKVFIPSGTKIATMRKASGNWKCTMEKHGYTVYGFGVTENLAKIDASQKINSHFSASKSA